MASLARVLDVLCDLMAAADGLVGYAEARHVADERYVGRHAIAGPHRIVVDLHAAHASGRR